MHPSDLAIIDLDPYQARYVWDQWTTKDLQVIDSFQLPTPACESDLQCK
jgi:hypothetical protein